MDKYLLAIAMQTAPVFGYLLASVLLANIKRRTQLITFGALFGVTLIFLSMDLYFTHEKVVNSDVNDPCTFTMLAFQASLSELTELVPPVLVVLASLFYSLGFGPVVFALLGEMFPARVKGFCCSFALAFR